MLLVMAMVTMVVVYQERGKEGKREREREKSSGG
jgi:hypothetical protein